MKCHLALLLLVSFSGVASKAQISVAGTIKWQDRNGMPHPVAGAFVQLWDARANVPMQGANGFTNEDGTYSLTGDTQGKSLSVQVRVSSRSKAAIVHPRNVAEEYEFDSSVHSSVVPGTALTVNLTGDSNEINDQAFSVLEAITYAQHYVTALGVSLDAISVNFPVDGGAVCGGPVSCFKATDPSLNILLFDRWDWDVAIHEYGHYVSRTVHIDQNPGGTHYINAHLEDYYDKGVAVRLAWGEGWPTFFSISAQNALNLKALKIPYVGDTHYTDTEDTTLDEDLASQSPDESVGEDNELSVSRILFYLFGGLPASHGSFHLSDKAIWTALTLQPISTLADSWSALTGKQTVSATASIGSVFAEHLAAPSLVQPIDGVAIDDEPISFSWKAKGAAESHPNLKFRFYLLDDNWKTIIDSGDLSTMSYKPSKTQWDELRKVQTSTFRWVVSGMNSDMPVTGPYSSYSSTLKP
jgi:hypothetical protein